MESQINKLLQCNGMNRPDIHTQIAIINGGGNDIGVLYYSVIKSGCVDLQITVIMI